MTTWQKDVGARRRIRAAVEDLMQRATKVNDASEGALHQALVHVKARRLDLAQNASFDLSYAADQCGDPDLRKRIEEIRSDLDKLVF